MILRYLNKLQPILNRVGKKHGIPVSEGKFIMGTFFKSLSNALSDPRLPKVMLPLFGVFVPRIKSINRSLKGSISAYKRGKITREYLNARIKRLWLIRNRVIKERNRENTWKLWNSKKFREYFDRLVNNEREEKTKSTATLYGSSNNHTK